MVVLSILIPCACVAIILLIWCIYVYILYAKLRNIPGPTPLIYIGNALEFKNTAEILNTFVRLKSEYGSIFKTIIGFDLTITVSDYKTLEFILGSGKIFINKSKLYRFFMNWLGTGLLTSRQAKWKKHRKLITPTFHFQILEQFIDVFNSASNILVQKLENETNKDKIEVFSFVSLCTLDIICETAMGTSVDAQKSTHSEYVQCVTHMSRILTERCVSPIEQNDFLYYFTKNGQTERHAIKVLHDYTTSVIKRRREELHKNAVNKYEESDIFTKKKQPFLDLLLQTSDEGVYLTDEEIRQEVDTFMFEGHDTTAIAISFAIYCLATNPDVQKKAVDELREIFQSNIDREASFRDLHDMKYLEMVIKETLRLYPSVPIYGREVSEPVEINGCTIPIGTTLNIFAYGIHRDPQYYPQPEQFLPERFATHNLTNIAKNPYSYIPFSAGPRNCIGQKFAMLEMKAAISNILKRLELLPVPGFKPKLRCDAVLKSTNGIYVRLKKRIW